MFPDFTDPGGVWSWVLSLLSELTILSALLGPLLGVLLLPPLALPTARVELLLFEDPPRACGVMLLDFFDAAELYCFDVVLFTLSATVFVVPNCGSRLGSAPTVEPIINLRPNEIKNSEQIKINHVRKLKLSA